MPGAAQSVPLEYLGGWRDKLLLELFILVCYGHKWRISSFWSFSRVVSVFFSFSVAWEGVSSTYWTTYLHFKLPWCPDKQACWLQKAQGSPFHHLVVHGCAVNPEDHLAHFDHSVCLLDNWFHQLTADNECVLLDSRQHGGRETTFLVPDLSRGFCPRWRMPCKIRNTSGGNWNLRSSLDYRCADEKNCWVKRQALIRLIGLAYLFHNLLIITAKKLKRHSTILRSRCPLKLSNSTSGCKVAVLHSLLNEDHQ